MGVVEGEQEGGAMPAPAEGPAQGGAAEAIYDRLWGRIASLATGNAGKLSMNVEHGLCQLELFQRS